VNEELTREWITERFRADTPNPVKKDWGDYLLNPRIGQADNLIPAAVLIPVVNREDELKVLFTRRAANLAQHAGQISFPGGHIEESDNEPIDAALRETEEEVGLPRHHIDVIGQLENYISRTGFEITPIVGVIEPPFTVVPQPSEVAEVFEVPLSFLLNPENHHRHTREISGENREFYAMPYGEYYIWGVTAGILVNLYEYLSSE
jgi:8-oxo-dGTP pyrophosphatase MutT (NUDIX family)